MEKREGVYNINFFKKVWYSITKFEQYPAMATEGFKRAIIYLITMVAIVTLFMSVNSLIEMHKVIGNLANYIEENIPEFNFENGNIFMENEEPIIIDKIQYGGIDRVIIEPKLETEEEKNNFEQEKDAEGLTIFFYKNQIVLRQKTSEGQINEQPYTYKDFIASYTSDTNIEKFNKAELVEYMTSSKMVNFYLKYTITAIISLLMILIMSALVDSLQIALFGWLTSIVARIRIRFVAIFNMAVYSLTLPMILNIAYIVVNYFTDFTISYFQVAYITIAYIYLAATIFILKDDIIKKMQEVEKIKEEQKKVREEIIEQEKPKEEPKDENPEEKKEDKEKDENNQGKEPDGSQA